MVRIHKVLVTKKKSKKTKKRRVICTTMTDTEGRDPAYFGYYAQYVHQQNMLQDLARTSAYQQAISANSPQITGKVGMDVGAGSGILSYFSVMAGASKVYAIEASNMAQKIKTLLNSTHEKNGFLKDKIQVIQEKIERPLAIPKVDFIVSEPIGVLLVHERMLESFLHARDHYLKPGGLLIPSASVIFLAPFSDNTLWAQTMSKARFWEQDNFYGVDFSPLATDARKEIFGQPIVGYFDSKILMAPSCSYHVDFTSITMKQLQEFTIPIEWTFPYTGLVHGVAGWFDIHLAGHVLSTGPNATRTHWQQVRFLLREPLAVNAYETVYGWLHLKINDQRSYDLYCELVVSEKELLSAPGCQEPVEERTISGYFRKRHDSWRLHEQTYFQEPYPMDYSRPEMNGMYIPELEM